MAKANIELPNGTKIVIEGDANEVAKVVAFVKGQRGEKTVKTEKGPKSSGAKLKMKPGPMDYIRELKTEGFFKEKRGLGDIQGALEVKGYIYPLSTLSGIMLKLIKKRELGRIKEGRKWKYVHRA